jgi:N-acetylglucosamine-6-phosphate deacetylase
MSQRLRGRLVTPGGVVAGLLAFDQVITALEPGPAGGPYILPGFVDVHVHGGGGGDAMDGPEGVYRLARFHLAHGSTTLLPTTITHPWEQVLAALRGVAEVGRAEHPDLPSLPGAHLEGPFISPKRLGAQPPEALPPTPEHVADLLALGVVRLATLAPEVPGAGDAARRLAAAGVRVGVGHTAADYETTRNFLKAVRAAGGVVGFTHLYNAMGGMTGRDPGALGAALADEGSWAELILDGHHVHEGGFRVALRAKGERLLLVTDAMRAAGQADGESELGGQRVFIADGAARLANGSLAGSLLTLDAALRHAVAAGLSLPHASRLVSAHPARYLGLSDRGRLEPGLRADLVVMGDDLRVQEVYVAGRRVV